MFNIAHLFRILPLFAISLTIVPSATAQPPAAEAPKRKIQADEERTLRKLEHQLSIKFKLERDLETLAGMGELDEKLIKYRDQTTMLLKHVEAAIAQLDPDGSMRDKLPPSREFKRLFESHQRLLEDQRYYASPVGLKDKRLTEKIGQLEQAIKQSELALLKQDPTGRWRKILEAEIKPDADRRKLPVPEAE